MKRLITLGLIFSLLLITPYECLALSKEQWRRADTIAKVTAENYEELGVLPSVAVAQAFVESTLGEHCSENNLWGINSCAESYPSLEAGIMRYLTVINNGCYPGAPFEKDYRKQIQKIIAGGYCEPAGPYVSNVIWSIEHYGFDRYDKLLPEYYTLKYSKKCPDYTVMINSEKASEDTVVEINGVFFDTVKKDGKKNVILVADKELDGKEVTIDFIENVKG